MHRFIVRASMLAQDAVTLDTARAHQIAVVLRMQPGEEITLVAGGDEAVAVLETVTPQLVVARIRERAAATREPRVTLTLAVPLLRGDRTEEVVEAVTQLGVHAIVPFVVFDLVLDRHSSYWADEVARILEPGGRFLTQQVGGNRDGRTWEELFEVLPRPVFVAWEGERELRLRDALPKDAGTLSLVIGPEGGLTDDEIALARSREASIVSLGQRNLRAETAAIAAVAIAMDVLD